MGDEDDCCCCFRHVFLYIYIILPVSCRYIYNICVFISCKKDILSADASFPIVFFCFFLRKKRRRTIPRSIFMHIAALYIIEPCTDDMALLF